MNMTETKLSPAEEDTYFPHDPEVTDFTFIVGTRKFHVAKVVLIDASPVFRSMFTGDFMEKNLTELELPGKDVTSFEFFLRCIYPRECTLTEESVFQVLPLADEYAVKCIQQKCEEWLLTELEFKSAKVSPHYINVENSIQYLTKCMYYAAKYRLHKLYATAFKKLLPFKLRRYIGSEYYQMMPETMKREILEKRLCQLEDNSNEVAGSTHMELEGLKRGLKRVEEAGIEVEALVTDRHGMVKKYMRTEHQDKKHYFDVWYLAKGMLQNI